MCIYFVVRRQDVWEQVEAGGCMGYGPGVSGFEPLGSNLLDVGVSRAGT